MTVIDWFCLVCRLPAVIRNMPVDYGLWVTGSERFYDQVGSPGACHASSHVTVLV